MPNSHRLKNGDVTIIGIDFIRPNTEGRVLTKPRPNMSLTCRLGVIFYSKAEANLGLRLSKQNGRRPMTAVVVTHAVGNIDTWLKGGADRKEVFPKFCSSHRIFRHPDQANRVSIVCENVDLGKLKAAMGYRGNQSTNGEAHRVDPVEVYIEVDGGS